MAKRILFFCSITIAAIALLGVLFSLIGNPINGDTWSRQFHNGSALYISSHSAPLSIGTHANNQAVSIRFGHVEYLWERH